MTLRECLPSRLFLAVPRRVGPLRACLLLAILSYCPVIFAQSDVALATRTAQLQALAGKLQERDQKDKGQAQAVASRLGIPLRRKLPEGRVLELRRFLPGIGPVFYTTYNIDAADTVSTDDVWPAGSAGLSLDGNGMTIGEWDGGAVEGDHPDLYGRVTQVDGATELSNHATHVAGTLIGEGTALYAEARGMAYAAHLDAYDWNADTTEMAIAAGAGLLVSNHSYGIATGWIYLGGSPPNDWWWIGGSADTDLEDPNFGYYDTEAQLWDQIANNAPYYLIVKAAGNDRWDVGPDPGNPYQVVDDDGQVLFESSVSRPADCAPAGYDCLPTTSVAKNILTIGAVDDVPGGYQPLTGASAVQMTSFSGWGPTDDGRIKPDLVGNGWLLLSTYAEDPYFAVAIGTSMAAPNVSGSLLLLQEHYQDIHGSGQFMRAATLKALAIHTADETGDAAGPDYEYGWGLLNTRKAAEVISEDGGGVHRIIEGTLAQGAANTLNIEITQPDVTLTATLVWNDPAGSPVVPRVLDDSTLMLVNDLDLRVSQGATTYYPWILNPASPGDAAGTGDNVRDNVEQVEAGGLAVGTYTIRVGHKNGLQSGLPQDYSLVISISPPAPTSSGLLIDEDFSDGMPEGWSVETLLGVDWSIEAHTPGSSRYQNGTGGQGNYAMVDNDFANSITSLRTPVYDLSSTESLVLRFKSYFPYLDLLENLNVDVSSNGGGSWNNAWNWYGFNPFPTNYAVDLTSLAAGQASAMFRFRWTSAGDPQGDLWQIDDIELEVFGGAPPPPAPPESELPGQADTPAPTNSVTGLELNTTLGWSSGPLATSSNVYLGTSSALGASDFMGNVPGTSYAPAGLAHDTQYYWRIDSVNDGGTTQGVTWTFTTKAAPALPTAHIADLDGSASDQPRNRWLASVEVEVNDESGSSVANATVTGNWSSGASGSGECLTGSGGRCTISKGNLKGGVESLVFTVAGVTHAAYQYQPTDNTDSESDSDGNSITVSRYGAPPEPPNTPPNIAIASPAGGSTFSSGVSINFNATASDAEDGDISASITWAEDGSSLGSGPGASLSTSFDDGAHTVTASVTDEDGETATDSVSFTVGEQVPPPPTSTATATITDLSTVGSRRWTAIGSVHISSGGSPVANATVTGSWSSGVKGSSSCVTNGSGECELSKGNLKKSVQSVVLTIVNVTGDGLDYSPASPVTETLSQ